MPKAVWRWLGLAGLVIVLDQITKLAVLGAFTLGESRELTGFFNLVLVYNRGAAFSFLSDAGGWQKWFFTVLALGISAWIVATLRRHSEETLLCLALSLIMGGALGNVIDRVAYGAVVDFLDFHVAGWHWPAFNVADSGITLGALLLVWEQMFSKGKPSAGEISS